jgi:hypothetical protein
MSTQLYQVFLRSYQTVYTGEFRDVIPTAARSAWEAFRRRVARIESADARTPRC